MSAFASVRYLSELSQLLRPPKSVDLDMDTTTIAGCVTFLDTLTRALVRGEVDTRKAQVLMGLARSQAAIIEGHELEQRMKRLESLLEAGTYERFSD